MNNKIEIDSSRKLKYIYGSNLDNTTDIKIISQELSGDSLSSDIWDSTRFINDDEITGSINKIRENFGIANNLSIKEPIGLEMLERILSITSSNTPSIAPPRRLPNKVAQTPPNKFSPPVIPERMSKDVLFPVCVDNHWILVLQSKKNQGNDAIVFHSGNEHALSPETQSKLAGLFNNIEYKHSALQDSELTPNACGLFLSKAIESVMTKDRRKPVTEVLDEFINEFSVMDSPQKLNFNISTRRSLYADFVDYFNTGDNRWISYSCLTRPTL